MAETPTFGGYDVENAIREARQYARRSDPLALETHRIAENYARHLTAQFKGRDLRLVAEAMLVSSASLGALMDTGMGLVALNVQAIAAVLVVDDLAPAERGERRMCTSADDQHTDGGRG